MAAAVTISTLDVQRTFTVNWVDKVGNETTGTPAGYSNPVWSSDDNGALVSSLPAGTGFCTVKLTGAAGVFNLKAVSSKSGAADLVGTTVVTVQGPVPDHYDIQLQP